MCTYTSIYLFIDVRAELYVEGKATYIAEVAMDSLTYFYGDNHALFPCYTVENSLCHRLWNTKVTVFKSVTFVKCAKCVFVPYGNSDILLVSHIFWLKLKISDIV